MIETSKVKEPKKVGEDFISIMDLVHLCINNWRWFILSFVVFFSFGIYNIVTKTKTYSKYASILVMEETTGNNINPADAQSEFNKLGMIKQNTNVSNVQHHITSLDVLTDVAKRLSMNITYWQDLKMRPRFRYGSQVPVEIKSLSDPIGSSFKMRVDRDESGSRIVLYDFAWGGNFSSEAVVVNENGGLASTPVGDFLVSPSPYWDSGATFDNLTVRVSSYMDAAFGIKRSLTASINNEKSTVIELKYGDLSPDRAKDFLYALVKVYNEKWIQDKDKLAISSNAFIDERLNLIVSDLADVDDSISTYKSRHGITELNQVTDLYLNQYSQSSNELLQLTNKLSVSRYLLDILKRETKTNEHNMLPTQNGFDNNVIETQIEEHNKIVLRLNDLLAYTSVQNPLVQRLQKQLRELSEGIVSSVNNQIETLEMQLEVIKNYSGAATSKIESNPDQAKYLMSIERQQKVKESLYLYLLKKKEETELSRCYTTDIIKMMDLPFGSNKPTSPVPLRIFAVCFVLSLLVPSLILFILEAMDDTVRSRDEILKRTNLPLIGEVPLVRTGGVVTRGKSRKVKIVIKENSQDAVNESFRIIRSNLEFLCNYSDKSADGSGAGASLLPPDHDKKNVFVVTSSYESSGKSFISANIAYVMAIRGRKVLLIDGDLRKATLSGIWSHPEMGLSNYLNSSDSGISKYLVADSTLPNLHIMPVGVIPPNPTELLASDRLQELINKVKRKYDYVFIDTPKMNDLADCGLIAKCADRTIYVIREGVFERKNFEKLQNLYDGEQFKRVSVIFNSSEDTLRRSKDYNIYNSKAYNNYYTKADKKTYKKN